MARSVLQHPGHGCDAGVKSAARHGDVGTSRRLCRSGVMARRPRPTTEEPQDKRGNFVKCVVCGRWVDMDDPKDVRAHERLCDGTPAPPPH